MLINKLQNILFNIIGSVITIFSFPHLVPLAVFLTAIISTILMGCIAIFIYNHFSKEVIQNWPHVLSRFVLDILKMPLIFLFVCYAIYIFSSIFVPVLSQQSYAAYFLNIIDFISFFWLIFNMLTIGKRRLLMWSFIIDNRLLKLLIPTIIDTLQAVLFLLMLNLFVPLIHFSGELAVYVNKLSKVLFIGVLGILFVQIVNALEKLVVNQYVQSPELVNFTGRKIQTQVLILKRVILTIGILITIASIFMVFDSVKNIGTGILTTAGLISAVGAFASQQSLSRLFAGLQIAFTQPLRIGDTVVIEDHLGQVEEITLSYIVIKLWDLRRLLLPTDHVTSKGLQNLTRDTTQLLGTIFFYTDYTLPVEKIRQKFTELLESSKLWDGKVGKFQVTEIKESTMEIRALVSAENSSTLWNLRCELRESLIQYIVEHYPQCLAKSRSITANVPFQPKDLNTE